MASKVNFKSVPGRRAVTISSLLTSPIGPCPVLLKSSNSPSAMSSSSSEESLELSLFLLSSPFWLLVLQTTGFLVACFC